MAKNVSECINRKKFVLDRIEFNSNDYFKFVGNAELEIVDRLETKSLSEEEFVVSVGRIISSKTENLFNLSVFYDIHFFFKAGIGMVEESDIDEYIENNYQSFTNVCMAKISLLISQITAQIGSGVPIVSSPYFNMGKDN